MEKEITPKSPKSTILEAYNELLEKIQTQSEPNGKQAKEKEEKKEIVKSSSVNSVEKIVDAISALKINITNSLDKVEDSLINEFKKLTQLNEAIKIQSLEIENLYKIKLEAESLTALLQAQKLKKQEFEDEMAEKEKITEIDFKDKKKSLEKELKDFETSIKEQVEQKKKQQQREEDDYKYNLELKRKKESDAYNAQRIATEKELTERESKISEKENLLAELQKKVETFPAELDKAIKSTEKTVTEKIESKYKYESQLAAKEIEGERKLKEQIISSLEIKIKEQENLIKQLTAKNDNAVNQVKDIAVKALEGSANYKIITKEKDKSDSD